MDRVWDVPSAMTEPMPEPMPEPMCDPVWYAIAVPTGQDRP